MAIIKKKASIWAYVLIALILVSVIALAVLHLVGFIDLSFLGEGFMGIMAWGATDVTNGIMLGGGFFAGGVLAYYVFKTYLVGTKVPITTGTYAPMGQQISQPQPQDEVVVQE